MSLEDCSIWSKAALRPDVYGPLSLPGGELRDLRRSGGAAWRSPSNWINKLIQS